LLIALPTAAFTAVEMWIGPGSSPAAPSVSTNPLGDLSAYQTIVARPGISPRLATSFPPNNASPISRRNGTMPKLPCA
jgi:hypothetical protein